MLQCASADDERAIRDIEERWQGAWNRHDMEAAAALFTNDAKSVRHIDTPRSRGNQTVHVLTEP